MLYISDITWHYLVVVNPRLQLYKPPDTLVHVVMDTVL